MLLASLALAACGGGDSPNQAPTITLDAPATATAGIVAALSASAADSDGSVIQVDFLEEGVLIGSAVGAPFMLAWTPSASGTRQLSARATDNRGASATSVTVPVLVAAATGVDTLPPTLSLTQPAALADDLVGTISLLATASDNVAVAGVEFQIDGMPLGAEVAGTPYQALVDTALFAAGQHVLRARARDTSGNLSPWATHTVRFGGSHALTQGFSKDEGWISGLNSATAFAVAADGRFFVAEQSGALRVVKNGALLPAAFHQFVVDANGERGLIGVALHPDFARNGWVYVHYTTPQGGVHNRISRLVANGDVSTGAETVLVDLPALGATNHNGGAIHFGVDGKLYAGVGDNADAGRAQDLATPFGKLLRFNDDGSIPADNPHFATQSGQARAVWASGLRNPFTFAVQPVSGRIHINDVGQDTWEEVNLGQAGANFGWPASEGPDNPQPQFSAPLFSYRHSATSPPGAGSGGFFTGPAITGGTFYPDSGNFPAAYRGSYFFADYLSRFVARMDLANSHAVNVFANFDGNPLDLCVAGDGALYVLTFSGITRIAAK